jgi:hypothetical protein
VKEDRYSTFHWDRRFDVIARLGALAVVLAACHVSVTAQGELIERTLALVGGEAITLSDVRGALALGLVEVPPAADPVPAATKRLIDRALMLREVQRYTPPEPPDTALDARLRAVGARFASADAFRAALASAGLSEVLLRAWLRDDLRIAAYLEQRFAAAESPERRAELVTDWISDLRRRTPVVELVKE